MTDETASRTKTQFTRPPPVARLAIVFPPALSRVVDITGRSVSVGREADVRVEEPSVSRQHLVIEWHAAQRCHVARDGASRHGTNVNGQGLDEPMQLQHGSVLRLADVVMVYEAAEGTANTPETERLPGRSLAMQRLRTLVERAAADVAPALIIGPTGAGKESVATELHHLSGRKGPLVAVNCAAVSAQLAESQLFGHVRGAFTGADAASPGVFRAATNGTLFLDEVGELPLELQPKLLRALQEREVIPVRASTAMKVDTRVVAATNRELAQAVADGRFRRDLYARLSLFELRVPALSERRADIVGWLIRFQQRWGEQRKDGTAPFLLDAEAVELLLLAPLPENLRALDRLVHELGDGGPFPPEALPTWLVGETSAASELGTERASRTPPARPTLRRPAPTHEEFEAVLRELGSVRATARHFGRDRRQIYRWIEQFGIEWSGD